MNITDGMRAAGNVLATGNYVGDPVGAAGEIEAHVGPEIEALRQQLSLALERAEIFEKICMDADELRQKLTAATTERDAANERAERAEAEIARLKDCECDEEDVCEKHVCNRILQDQIETVHAEAAAMREALERCEQAFVDQTLVNGPKNGQGPYCGIQVGAAVALALYGTAGRDLLERLKKAEVESEDASSTLDELFAMLTDRFDTDENKVRVAIETLERHDRGGITGKLPLDELKRLRDALQTIEQSDRGKLEHTGDGHAYCRNVAKKALSGLEHDRYLNN